MVDPKGEAMFAREDRDPTQRLYIEARRLFGSMSAARKAANDDVERGEFLYRHKK